MEKINKLLDAIINEDGDSLSYGSHRTIKIIRDELKAQSAATPPDVEQIKKILQSFYQFLENNGKFPNTSGWAEFWADKYLEWAKNHPDVLSDVNK